MTEISNMYNTDLILPPNIRIIAFSDIHADIHALIICLRDCAKVIKSTKSMEEIENFLNIDICDEDNGYLDDLGFEWIGENTHIVIIGDIIDGSRGNEDNVKEKYIESEPGSESSSEYNTTIHDYHQIEIKILRFINSLHEKAINHNHNCYIHKLLGNHEVENIIGNRLFKTQTFLRLKKLKQYIKNRETTKYENRFNTFFPGGEGFKLLFKNQIGLLLKINNNIFVHGSLKPIEFETIKLMNNFLNNSTTDESFINFLRIFTNNVPRTSDLLWGRYYGHNLYDEHSDGIEEKNHKMIYCKDVEKDLETLMGKDVDIKNYHVIVGHCIQMDKNIRKVNTTFTEIENVIKNEEDIIVSEIKNEEDIVVSEILKTATTGTVNVSENRFFGITMKCKNEDDNYKVYRVDVGSSRAQDPDLLYKEIENNIINEETEKIYLLGRSPQVLEISEKEGKTEFRIIRSTIENTRSKQPRPKYEDYRKRTFSSNQSQETNEDNYISIENNTHNDGNSKFIKKYLKYKNKYLQYKKIFKKN